MTMPRDGMPIDQKCIELAAHFLNSDATEEMKRELAGWIQWQINNWLYDDKAGARRAAETLGDPVTLG